jgi:hypothetical protein
MLELVFVLTLITGPGQDSTDTDLRKIENQLAAS